MGRVRNIFGVWVIGLASLLNPPLLAGESQPIAAGFEYLDLVFDPALLDDVGETLHLSDSQQRILASSQEQYFDTVHVLEKQCAKQVEANELDYPGKPLPQIPDDDPYWAKRARSVKKCREVIARANRQADEKLYDLFEKLELFLTDEQKDRIPDAFRLIRRKNALGSSKPAHRSDLDQQIDLFEVVAQASEPGGPLAWLSDSEPDESDEDGVPNGCKSPRERLHKILNEYALRVDRVLQKRFNRVRYPDELLNEGRPVKPGTKAHKEYMTVWAKSWANRTDPHWYASQQISALLEECKSRQHRREWETIYWKALAPKMMRDLWIDDDGSALLASFELDDDQHDALHAILQDYHENRHRLRRNAIENGRMAMRTCAGLWGTHPKQVSYVKALVALMDAHYQVIDEIQHILSDEQATQWQQAVERARKYKARSFRLWIAIPEVLKELGLYGPPWKYTWDPADTVIHKFDEDGRGEIQEWKEKNDQ